MPRIARCQQRALCFHVMNRGVNRQPIFRDDADRRRFGDLVRRFKDLYHVKVYHWSWMSNHYHLLVEVPHERLRKFVGGFQQVYAQYHHARHDGSGLFWQGRFKSKPVEVGAYLVSCGRYIERNPLRAGLVAAAEEYRWSSAAAYVRGTEDGLTDRNPHLGAFSARDRQRYREALRSGADEELIRGAAQGAVIGGSAFAASLRVKGGRHKPRIGRPSNRA